MLTIPVKIRIIAGDFKRGSLGAYENHIFKLRVRNKILRQKIPMDQVKSLEILDSSNQYSVAKGVGGAVAGSLLFGGLGLLGGALLGSRNRKIRFECKFNDGRKMIAEAKLKVYDAIYADFY